MRTKMNVIGTFLGITFVAFLAAAEDHDPLDVSRCPSNLAKTRYLRASSWDMCYEFHKEERSWRSAAGICSTRGGLLVIIKEYRVQAFLRRSLMQLRWPRRALWIGANDRRTEMDWRWITGEKVKDGYSNWASGQPSCGFFCMEDCAIMRWREGGGKWHDYRCNLLEDYSFVCQFDMLPPPTPPTTTVTTPTTTTSTTSTTTTSTTTTTTTTSTTTTPKPTKANIKVVTLGSEYLKHRQNTLQNRTRPSVISYSGVNEARHGEVKQVNNQSAGLTSGTVIGLIVGILIGLSCAVCVIFFILVRRRRRKESAEDDLRISYENPYYGEANGQPPTGNSNGHAVHVVNDEPKREDKDTDVGCASGGYEQSSHYVSKKFGGSTVPHKEHREDTSKLQHPPPPPSPLHARPKMVMNNYDTPPTFLSQRSAEGVHNPNRKSADSMGGYKRMDRSLRKGQPRPEEEENYYTKVHSPRRFMYDVPRSRHTMDYANGDAARLRDEDFDHNNFYYNEEENMYESLEHLGAPPEEQNLMDSSREKAQRQDDDVDDEENVYVNGVKENKYVPLRTEENEYY